MTHKRPRGRPQSPGKYYRFGLRFRPGFDPPELEVLLETLSNADSEARAVILRAALIGGAKAVQEEVIANTEKDGGVLTDFFDNF